MTRRYPPKASAVRKQLGAMDAWFKPTEGVGVATIPEQDDAARVPVLESGPGVIRTKVVDSFPTSKCLNNLQAVPS